MVIYIDIDETICFHPEGSPNVARDYNLASPIIENINKANKLYDNGNTIIYWTARGSTTGIDWTELTTKQLKDWGVKYHELRLDKPFYDLFIDDKVLNTENWI
tara:strand:- start:4166 stop:4474 length:309 start_codon:yes stop_codon:yes gene_type:complete